MYDHSNPDLIQFKDMTWNTKMVLFSAWVKGQTIQYWSNEHKIWSEVRPSWIDNIAYRMKPEPIVNPLNHSPRSIGRSQAVYCH